jgi:hypothetical protein
MQDETKPPYAAQAAKHVEKLRADARKRQQARRDRLKKQEQPEPDSPHMKWLLNASPEDLHEWSLECIRARFKRLTEELHRTVEYAREAIQDVMHISPEELTMLLDENYVVPTPECLQKKEPKPFMVNGVEYEWRDCDWRKTGVTVLFVPCTMTADEQKQYEHRLWIGRGSGGIV